MIGFANRNAAFDSKSRCRFRFSSAGPSALREAPLSTTKFRIVANAKRALYRAPAMFSSACTIRFRTKADKPIVSSGMCDFAHRIGPGGNPCHLIGAINRDSAVQRGSPKDTTCERQPLSFGMAEIVNLRMARKRANRSKAEHHAAEQRVAHGASKSERSQAAADRDTARHTLDQHRIERGDHR